MSENHHFGDGKAGKEANDFGQTIATTSSKENSEHVMQPFDSKRLQLRFMNHIPDMIYTGLPIEGKEGIFLTVALFDAATGNVVNCGSEASAMVEILVVDKTFNKNDTEDWTFDEFKAKILAGRHVKTPLLRGNTCFNLIEGVGLVGKIFFRHTRHPVRKTELRLGARIMACFDGTRIREAVSEPFTVKDRRGMNKKHYLLKPTDPVWRLVNIGKNGPFQKKLQVENITTVRQFLTEYTANPQRLKNILGKSMSAEKLKATANHAQTCNCERKEPVHFSPVFQQNSHVEMGLLLETEHASTQMCFDTKEADDSDMETFILEDCNGDVIADDEAFRMNASFCLFNEEYSSNSLMVSNSEGCNGSMYASFNQLLDIEDPASSDAFSMVEDLWHFINTGTITDHQQFLSNFCEDEHQQFLNPFCPPQATLFSPTDPPRNSVVADSEVKKKLVILFTVSKWFLKIDSMAAFEGDDSQSEESVN